MDSIGLKTEHEAGEQINGEQEERSRIGGNGYGLVQSTLQHVWTIKENTSVLKY